MAAACVLARRVGGIRRIPEDRHAGEAGHDVFAVAPTVSH